MTAAFNEEEAFPAMANAASPGLNGQYGDEEVWISDSAATHHMSRSKYGMFNFRPVTSPRSVGLPEGSSEIEGYRCLDVAFRMPSGADIILTLNDVLFVPKFKRNLFSLNAAADRGHFATVTNTGTHLMNGDLNFPRKNRLCVAVGRRVPQPLRPTRLSPLVNRPACQ